MILNWKITCQVILHSYDEMSSTWISLLYLNGKWEWNLMKKFRCRATEQIPHHAGVKGLDNYRGFSPRVSFVDSMLMLRYSRTIFMNVMQNMITMNDLYVLKCHLELIWYDNVYKWKHNHDKQRFKISTRIEISIRDQNDTISISYRIVPISFDNF